MSAQRESPEQRNSIKSETIHKMCYFLIIIRRDLCMQYRVLSIFFSNFPVLTLKQQDYLYLLECKCVRHLSSEARW